MQFPLKICCCGFLTLLLTDLCVAPAVAQFGQPETEEELLLTAPRALRRQLQDAKDAIAEQRYTAAVEALGSILINPQPTAFGELPDQDFLLETIPSGLLRGSLRTEASRMLGELPAKGREVLELQFGVEARKTLETALADNDLQALEEVSRRYFHTAAGYEATLLLAQYRLTAGQPLSAAITLDRLLNFEGSRLQFGSSLAALAAAAWMEAGRTDLASATLDRAAEIWPDARIAWGDTTVQLSAGTQWASRLPNLFSPREVRSGQIAERWLMAGGDAQRNAEAAAGMPLPTARWWRSTNRDQRDEIALADLLRSQEGRESSLIPTPQPLVVNGVVLIKTTDRRLFAFDFATGKIKWLYWMGSSQLDEMVDQYEAFPNNNFDEPVSRVLKERVFGQMPQGLMAADTDRVYLISDLEVNAEAAVGNRNANMRMNLMQMQFGMGNPSSNYLDAVSLTDEGKLVWRIGGPVGSDEPALAGAYFLGPALPVDNSLFALAEINGETRLICLDPATGRLQWQQQLVQATTVTIASDEPRRNIGAMLSYANGIMICNTGAGAVLAMDLASRSIRWVYRYPKLNEGGQRFNGFGAVIQPRDFDALSERWVGSTQLIADGCAIVTPADSAAVYCLDLATGEVLWTRDRGDLRYVAAAYDGRVIFVGNRSMTSIGIRSGGPMWAKPLVLGETDRVSGIGVRRANKYFLPLSDSRVLEIDLNEGAISRSTQVDQPVGNLLGYKNQLISVSPFNVAVYHTVDDLRQQVDQRLAADPSDIWALSRRGELLLAAGNRVDALATLRSAYEKQPDNDEVRYLLVETMLASLKADFATHRDTAAELEGLVELAPQRNQFLTLMIEGNRSAGELMLAFERLLELSDYRVINQPSHMFDRSESISPDKAWTIDEDAFLAAEALRLIQQASPEVALQMQEKLKPRVAAIGERSLAIRRQWLKHFRWIPGAEPVILSTVKDLVDNSEFQSAQYLLLPLLRDQSSQWYNDALLAMANLQSKAGRGLEAARLWKLAGKDSQRVPVTGGDNELGELLYPESLVENAFDPDSWPTDTAIIQQPPSRMAAPTAAYPIPVRYRTGDSLNGWQFIDDNNILVIMDPWGEVVSRLSISNTQRISRQRAGHIVATYGDLIVIQSMSEVLAIDTVLASTSPADAVLWRHQVSATSSGTSRIRTEQYERANHWGSDFITIKDAEGKRLGALGPILDSGVTIRRGDTITCLSHLTGARVWERSGLSESSELVGHGNQLYLLDPTQEKYIEIDGRDGKIVRQSNYPQINFDAKLTRSEVKLTEGNSLRLSSLANRTANWITWTSLGSRILDFRFEATEERSTSRGGAIGRIRLWDVATGETVLERRFASDTYADVCENRYFIAMQPDGLTVMWDLETGKEVEHQLSVAAGLRSIHVERFEDRLILMQDTKDFELDGIGLEPSRPGAPSFRFVCGNVYAISRKDGRLLWQSPAEIHNFAFPVAQVRRSPVLSFVRRLKWYQTANSPFTERVSMALLNITSGELLFASNNLESNRGDGFSSKADPMNHVVTIGYSSKTIDLKLVDGPVPPQPVARFGDVTQAELKKAEEESQRDRTRNRTRVDPFELFQEPNEIPR